MVFPVLMESLLPMYKTAVHITVAAHSVTVHRMLVCDTRQQNSTVVKRGKMAHFRV